MGITYLNLPAWSHCVVRYEVVGQQSTVYLSGVNLISRCVITATVRLPHVGACDREQVCLFKRGCSYHAPTFQTYAFWFASGTSMGDLEPERPSAALRRNV